MPGCYARAVKTLALFLLSCSLVVGCKKDDKPAESPSSHSSTSSDSQCREDVADDVEMGARTGVSGAKTGVTTAGEGIKTFGKSAAGLAEGGSDEAKKRWREGKEDTKATAREGAHDTKHESHKPKCANR